MIRWALLLVSFTLFAAACQKRTAPPAPVEVCHGAAGGQPYALAIESSASVAPPKQISEKKPIKEAFKADPSRPDFVIVKEGETLYSIASQYKMSGAEIITINRLQAPYRVEIGQKLYLREQLHLPAEPGHSDLLADNSSAFIWPVQGRVITNYGENGNEGINIASPKNTPVYATQAGKVTYVGSDLEDFGKMILITHDNNWRSAYAHLSSAAIEQGEDIQQGQVIGYVGQSGSVKSPQLHFELRKGANSVDPAKHLKETH